MNSSPSSRLADCCVSSIPEAPRDWRVVALALGALPVLRAGLAIAGYQRLHATLRRWPGRVAARAWTVDAAAMRAQTVARAVGTAAVRGPVRATCLPRALLTWWLLRREGIASCLRIGVAREGGVFKAHAWVEHAGRPLGDDPEIARRFLDLDRDFATLAPGAR